MCLHEPGGAKGVNSLSGEALNVGKFNCDPQLQMDYLKQGNGRYLNRRLIKWISETAQCEEFQASHINKLQIHNKLKEEDARPPSSPQITSSHLIFKQKHLYHHLKEILIPLLNTEAQKPKKADPARAFLHSKWSSWKRLQQDVQI